MAMTYFRGNFSNFLDHLREFESGIRVDKFDWYIDNYERPAISYPKVESVGRIARDPSTGNGVNVQMTVRGYFQALGIDDLFDMDSPNCMRQMQYAAVNFLGFVGYQFGEAILSTCGYYEPEIIQIQDEDDEISCVRRYCGEIDNKVWAGNCNEVFYHSPFTRATMIATDVNRWHGTFTGKDEIHSFTDLKQPEKQELVIRSVLRHNYEFIAKALDIFCDDGISRRIGNEIIWPSSKNADIGHLSLSGALAAAHLCGPEGTVKFLTETRDARDEFGTSIERYLFMFHGYLITAEDLGY
jgi:hypothetical protein